MEQISQGILINDDALKILKEIPDKSIDLILTDPPYGKINNLLLQGQNRIVDWDISLDWKYLFQEFNRLIKNGGTIIVFGQSPTYNEMILANVGNFKYEYIWEKNNCAQGFHYDKMPLIFTENIAVFIHQENKDNKRTFNTDFKKEWEIDWTNFQTRNYAREILNFINLPRTTIHKMLGHRKLKFFLYYNGVHFQLCSEKLYQELIDKFQITKMKNYLSYQKLKTIWQQEKEFNKGISLQIDNISGVSNILKYSKDRPSYHPTQKPLKLIQELIKRHSNQGDLILDPFCGSGTIPIACEKLNRCWIGIEIDPKYYKSSIIRIKKELLLK